MTILKGNTYTSKNKIKRTIQRDKELVNNLVSNPANQLCLLEAFIRNYRLENSVIDIKQIESSPGYRLGYKEIYVKVFYEPLGNFELKINSENHTTIEDYKKEISKKILELPINTKEINLAKGLGIFCECCIDNLEINPLIEKIYTGNHQKNNQSGHRFNEQRKRHKKTRNQRKARAHGFRPEIPYQKAGNGEINHKTNHEVPAEFFSDLETLARYNQRDIHEQSLPKIDWQHERFRNNLRPKFEITKKTWIL